jgi:hypothetical protein
MYRLVALIAVASFCLLHRAWAQADLKADSPDGQRVNGVGMTLIHQETTDQGVRLRYRISNNSAEPIWVCDYANLDGSGDADIGLAGDGQALLIRRRLDVPFQLHATPPLGRYVPVRPGESRTEYLLLPFPVCRRLVFGPEATVGSIVRAKNIRIQIGYYVGDLPAMLRRLLGGGRATKGLSGDIALIQKYLGDLENFNAINENARARHRGGELRVYHNFQALKGEKMLELNVHGVSIPYEGEHERVQHYTPDLSTCNRIEAHFQPSALEFFFPSPEEHSLLGPAEAKDLESLNAAVARDPKYISTLIQEIPYSRESSIITERSKASLVCYHDEEHLASFVVYDRMYIMTERGLLFVCPGGLDLGLLFSQVRPYELRLRCADHLDALKNRLYSYLAEEKKYPVAATWCDVIVDKLKVQYTDDFVMAPFVCPGKGAGQSNYAMNPNCRHNSSPDTVLLFETETGWNQHGGPDLFAFDNHDPRGGLVLLNDGTVKFIRTKEELKQLRWD